MGSVYAELHVEDVKNFEERQKSEIKARVLQFMLTAPRESRIFCYFAHFLFYS